MKHNCTKKKSILIRTTINMWATPTYQYETG